jgi:hypothetical protein
MVVLIFDTFSGLCNQFYDIINGINFCLIHNIKFTFRYCSFRSNNLITWEQKPFEKIFDLNFLNKYEQYIDYYTIKDSLTNDNCYNLNNTIVAIHFLNPNNILDQLINFNKDYVVLNQFWSVCLFKNIIDNTIHNYIFPCKDIMDKYIEIKNTIIKDEQYNYIHYRYEIDFTNHFNIKVESLDSLIENIQFKNNNLKIFVATSNIKNLLDLNNPKYNNIVYKDDDTLMDLNYEQLAFIDYMFGINSVECYGHSKSSFSNMLNSIKQTNNFYNILQILNIDYGIHDNFINITDKAKELFFKNNILFIPKETNLNDTFGDPCFGITKEIKINAILNNKPICICEKEFNCYLENNIMLSL